MPLEKYASSLLPTEWGEFTFTVFQDEHSKEHVAISTGELKNKSGVLTRVHSACFTGEALSSLKCDCKAQLEYALREIQAAGRGVVIYLFQEGRDIGLGNKIRAYALQSQGEDTVDANVKLGFGEDQRTYDVAIDMIKQLEIRSVKVMTNNPLKIEALQAGGVDVLERVPVEVGVNQVNAQYLETKRDRMGHMLSLFNES